MNYIHKTETTIINGRKIFTFYYIIIIHIVATLIKLKNILHTLKRKHFFWNITYQQESTATANEWVTFQQTMQHQIQKQLTLPRATLFEILSKDDPRRQKINERLKPTKITCIYKERNNYER